MIGALAAHWRLVLAQGVLMVIFGMLALAAPLVATLAIDIYVGWLFLFSGVFGIAAIFSARRRARFGWGMITAALSLALGAALVWNPLDGVVSLTMLLTAFLIAEGLFQTISSLTHRMPMPSAWGWMLMSGLADLVVAAIILWSWPQSVSWALGIIAGVNLLTSGWAIAMAALAGHEIASATASLVNR